MSRLDRGRQGGAVLTGGAGGALSFDGFDGSHLTGFDGGPEPRPGFDGLSPSPRKRLNEHLSSWVGAAGARKFSFSHGESPRSEGFGTLVAAEFR